MCNLCANKITITKEILKKDEEALDVRGKKYLKQVKRLTKLLEQYFMNVAEDSIRELEETLISKTSLMDGIQGADDWFDEWRDDLNIELQKTYKVGANVQEASIQSQISIGLSIGISDDKAKEYAQTRIGDFISDIDENTKLEIRNIINDGMDNKKSVKEVAKDIQDKFTDFSGWRATLIANVEGSQAYSYGKVQQFEGYLNEFGAPGWKKTMTQGDDKVRDSHLEAERLGRVPYKQEYIDTDGEMQFSTQQAPFSFNCRCDTVYSLFNPDTNSIR